MKGIGAVCYFLIVSSIVLLLTTLIASQGLDLLHLSKNNRFDFDLQIALSFLHCLITLGCAIAMLNGYLAGRRLWSAWVVSYLLLNIWQFASPTPLLPVVLVLLMINFVLYGKPAQVYFTEQRAIRSQHLGRRVDQSFNIFDTDD